MAKLKQAIRFKAKNKKATYKRKYTVAQKITTANKLKTTKYNYSKVTIRKKYTYA